MSDTQSAWLAITLLASIIFWFIKIYREEREFGWSFFGGAVFGVGFWLICFGIYLLILVALKGVHL